MEISFKEPNVIKIAQIDSPSNSASLHSSNLDILCFDGAITVRKDGQAVIEQLSAVKSEEEYKLTFKASYNGVFGLGERFDRVNQKNLSKTVSVEEKFCNQGELTYCPIPFFLTDSGFGIYIDELSVTRFSFSPGEVSIDICNNLERVSDIYLIFGTPKEIVSQFSRLTGVAVLPPKWAFGPWMSGHRWSSRAMVEEQLMEAERNGMPFNVLVIEQWSDEGEFIIWNDVKYQINSGKEPFQYSDFTFESNSLWPDLKGMIEKLHKKGIKLVLWQVPAIKKPENKQHEMDYHYARAQKLVALNADGTPYEIPEGHWFPGAMIPDFTNPEARKWWFGKRQYLLDIGVDGFKSDGGEFVYRDDIYFHDGRTGKEMKNGYVQSYLKAYAEFIGPNRILFSRAGYTGMHNWPMLWAGDQMSTWKEFKAIIVAGLSAGLSGIPVWSFDIAGFAGPMPSVELYERATQTAVFTPGMQFHSEPIYGQFAKIMPSAGGKNDRSPWNMAKAYNDPALVSRMKFHYDLRMNLMPTIYNEAVNSSETGQPMMRHLFLEYPQDSNTIDIEDEFMLGDLLVAPIISENSTSREVYLPEGQWIDLWSGVEYKGGTSLFFETGKERIPVLIRKGGALALNLGDSMKPGSFVGNSMDNYKNLCFLVTGDEGHYRFRDDLGNETEIEWAHGEIRHKAVSGSTPYRILESLW